MITDSILLQSLADQVCQLCAEAGAAILHIYQSESSLQVDYKSDDSPLTEADKLAHNIICEGLSAITPQWPILSEEQEETAYERRRQWSCYWLVDPLDGTREFIGRTGEFTINVALVEEGKPVLGVVYVPLQGTAYVGIPQQQRAYKSGSGSRQDLHVSTAKPEKVLRVLTSSRHRNDQLLACIALLEKNFSTVQWLKAGSALKFCRLAEGLGDIYPRFSPCSEWDTAAGQALLEAAGGSLVGIDFKPLRYNQRPSLINPSFYALAGVGLNWRQLLASMPVGG